MSPATPIIVLLFSSLLYFFIGYRLRAKTYADPSDAFAWRAFRAWWMGMSLNTLLNALAIVLFSLGITAMPLFFFFSFTSSVAAATALWGLLTYLLYVYTGKDRSRLVAVFYVGFIAFLFIALFLFQPNGVRMGDYAVAMDYSNPPTGVGAFVFAISFILLLGLPPVIAAIGMFLLFLRIKERSAKYRAGLVSLGIFMIFGLAYILPLILFPLGVRTGEISWWQPAMRIIGLLALGVIYFAYFPPTFIRRRFNVATVLG